MQIKAFFTLILIFDKVVRKILTLLLNYYKYPYDSPFWLSREDTIIIYRNIITLSILQFAIISEDNPIRCDNNISVN